MDEQLVAKIKNHYQKGEGSIQDLARIYRLEVDEVLDILGLSDMKEVEGMGDLIGTDEAGPEAVIRTRNTYKPRYTTN